MRRFRATELPTDSRMTLRHLAEVIRWLGYFRGRTILALALLFGAKIATVGVPLILKRLVDLLEPGSGPAGSEPSGSFFLAVPLGLVLAYGVARLCAGAFTELRDTLFARVRYGILRRVSVQVLGHLHELSLRFHLERRTGGIHRDVARGSQSLSTLLNTVVFNLLPTLVELTLVLIILLRSYRPAYALVVFGSTLTYATLTFLLTEWRIKFRVEMNKHDARASALAIDSLLNFETVQLFNNQGHEVDRYDSELRDWEDAAVRSQSSLTALNLTQSAIIAIGLTILLAMGVADVQAGAITIGDFVAIHAFLLQLFIPLGMLGMLYSMFKHALSDMEQMFVLLDTEQEVEEAEGAVELVDGGGAIEFQDIHFQYEDDRPILKGVNLKVNPGERVALVGESGSGKSTIVRLLFRLYDPSSGEILIDGQDVTQLTLRSLRDAISIVPQDPVLFHDSLKYNILYGRLDASPEELDDAIDRAQLRSLVERLPRGLDTVVGERGLKLSGGEKQRVAIARAMLKAPRIYIFDEATSSLDNIAEAAIAEAMRSDALNATALVIAHRLSTIVDADRIIVIGDGEIIEEGDHHSLLEMGGQYASLWRKEQEARADL